VVLWWEDLVTGKLSNGAYIMTLCYDRPLQRVNFLDIQLRGRLLRADNLVSCIVIPNELRLELRV
jgi:hypothetical protein